MSLGHTNGIQNWANHAVKLDFKNLRWGPEANLRPSDIDMFFLYGKTLIIGDAKNSVGTLHDGQKRVYERLVDRWCEAYGHEAYFIWFSHDKFQQYGDETVDVADCEIEMYYFNRGKGGQWVLPNLPTTVKEAMDKILVPKKINEEWKR